MNVFLEYPSIHLWTFPWIMNILYEFMSSFFLDENTTSWTNSVEWLYHVIKSQECICFQVSLLAIKSMGNPNGGITMGPQAD